MQNLSAIQLNDEGKKLSNNRQYNLAESYFKKAIQLDPNFAKPYNNMGNIFLNRQPIDNLKAKQYYQKALTIDSNYEASHYNLGLVYNRLDKHDKAIEQFEKSIKINPLSMTFAQIAKTYKGLQQLDKALNQCKKGLQLDPNDVYCLQTMGQIYKDQKLYKEAIQCYLKIHQVDQQRECSHSWLADIYFQQQQYEKAIKQHEKQIQYSKNQTNNQIDLSKIGLSYQKLQKYQLAKQFYQKSIELNPNYSYGYNMYGNLYYSLKQFKKCIPYLEKAIQLNPNQEQFYINLQNAYINQKQNDKIKGLYERACKHNPKNEFLMQKLAYILSIQGKYQQSVKLYKTVLQFTKNQFKILDNTGKNYFNQKKYDEAFIYYEQSFKLKPDYQSNLFNLGQYYYAVKKDYKKALQYFQKILLSDPNNDRANNWIGNCYIKQKKFQMSKVCYEKVLQINPNSQIGLLNYAVCLIQLNQSEKAIQILKKGISLYPKTSKVSYNNLAIRYILRNDIKGAFQCFQKCVQTNPDYGNGHNGLGTLQESYNKNFEKAINHKKKAVQLQPNNILFLTGLGHTYFKNNNIEQAYKCFSKVKQIMKNQQELQKQMDSDIDQNNINFIKQTLELFQQTHGKIEELKLKFKQNQSATEYIKLNQKEVYQPMAKLFDDITQNQQGKIQVTEKQFKKQSVNINQQILMRLLKLQAQVMQLKVQNAILKKRMDKFVTKQELQNLSKQIQNFGKDNIKIKEQIMQLQDKLYPQKSLQEKFDELQKQKKIKVQEYGKNIFWMINANIAAYRMAKLGLIKNGENLGDGRVGEIVKKMMSVLDIGEKLPLVGDACGIINAMASIYVDQSQTVIISKISGMFDDLWSEKQVTKVVSQAVLILLQNQKFCQQIESLIANQDIFTMFNQCKAKVISKIEGIKLQNTKVIQSIAIADASFFIGKLSKFDTEQIPSMIKKYKQQEIYLIQYSIKQKKYQYNYADNIKFTYLIAKKPIKVRTYFHSLNKHQRFSTFSSLKWK